MLSDTAAGRVETVRSHADASSQIPWLISCYGYGIKAGTVVQSLHGHQWSDHLTLFEYAVRVVHDGERGQTVRRKMRVGNECGRTQSDVTAEGMW